MKTENDYFNREIFDRHWSAFKFATGDRTRIRFTSEYYYEIGCRYRYYHCNIFITLHKTLAENLHGDDYDCIKTIVR